jgi:hypothetical protein
MTVGGGGLVGEQGRRNKFLFFIFFKIFNWTDM